MSVMGLLFLGCSDQGFSSVERAGGSDPQIAVTPRGLEFDSQGLDDEPQVQTFTIQSVGDSDLFIDSVEMEEGGSFEILTDIGDLRLPPGAEQEIEVRFFPLQARENADLSLVSSNDPINALLPVELFGFGDVPELMIDPNPLDFGATFVGCAEDNYVDLHNVGTDDLVLSSFELLGESVDAGELRLPLEVPPGEFERLPLVFDPLSNELYETTLRVFSNEPLGQRDADQWGEGKYPGEGREIFELPADQPADVLFLVDQSCSMDDNAAAMAQQFESYINDLSLFTGDWQVAVANRASGCNHTGVLTPETPNYVGIFQGEINSGDGEQYIDDPERLLIPAALAVEKTGPDECNAGFMRDEAILHVILVSDEPEQSEQPWNHYVERIQEAKGSVSMTRVSAIAGAMDGVCSGPGSSAPGTGYHEATLATGGQFLDICSDWAENMEALALASASRNIFELEETPVPWSVEVWVNSQPRDDWEFDASLNAVVFQDLDNMPSSGDRIQVDYGVAAPCD